jgi:hypothetical protein
MLKRPYFLQYSAVLSEDALVNASYTTSTDSQIQLTIMFSRDPV